MAIKDDFDALVQERNERISALQFRDYLDEFTLTMYRVDGLLQDIFDSGDFDTLPTTVKTVLNQWWNALKSSRDVINGNQDIQDIYQWRP